MTLQAADGALTALHAVKCASLKAFMALSALHSSHTGLACPCLCRKTRRDMYWWASVDFPYNNKHNIQLFHISSWWHNF